MDNKEAMLLDLKGAIETWLNGKKSRSLSMLAHRTNKAYSTIRYIAQGERLPNESTIFSITDIIMPTQERVAFFKSYFPKIGELMESAYSHEVRNEPHHEMLRRYLNKEPHNRIFNIAATSHGTNRTDIRVLLGDVGIQALQEMIDEGFLVEDDRGSIHYSSDSWALTDVDDILSQVKMSISHFDKSLIGTDAASLVNMTASVSQDQLSRVKKLIQDFARELSSLKNDDDAKGNVAFFCNLIYSIYDQNQWRQSQGDLH
ncbi:hypothetical protein [Pseudobacteriovorax antillogorgiicola]|uniref:TIGR02147 family protein n=1 Tax=Pseudobacteriovorax antillogorgiicola TaxID=1513793 RepID=A0A1Y6CFS7_9BACT|nr:hypothetical protein [Pseudobacteriovorax antillogorgiicola]TCS47311.1 hypothetical protein EDD56_12186 [Pseudobacteriovorax antillogorgiicola]SMF62641.1 hypothetical protein SAMN06296036_12186 [Pseudobacteriovorax antillogorgiicola]